jgi:SAM-dependent methyltransferase
VQLTNRQRVQKLAGNLISHPGLIPRYVLHNCLARPSPIDVELPWFSYGAIDFLEAFLRPEMTVFEFGSGGSTLFFAERCRSVESVDEDRDWAAQVQARAAARSLNNIILRICPYDFSRVDGFEGSEYLAQIRGRSPDVVVVDGSDDPFVFRPICFRVAEEQVAPGGIIVVDDSWRYPDFRRTHRASAPPASVLQVQIFIFIETSDG